MCVPTLWYVFHDCAHLFVTKRESTYPACTQPLIEPFVAIKGSCHNCTNSEDLIKKLPKIPCSRQPGAPHPIPRENQFQTCALQLIPLGIDDPNSIHPIAVQRRHRRILIQEYLARAAHALMQQQEIADNVPDHRRGYTVGDETGLTMPLLATVKESEAGPCAICADDDAAEERVRLPCGHVFGRQCILRWLRELEEREDRPRPSCPNCRRTWETVWDLGDWGDEWEEVLGDWGKAWEKVCDPGFMALGG